MGDVVKLRVVGTADNEPRKFNTPSGESLIEALRQAYPVRDDVQDVDEKFMALLDKIAAMDLTSKG